MNVSEILIFICSAGLPMLAGLFCIFYWGVYKGLITSKKIYGYRSWSLFIYELLVGIGGIILGIFIGLRFNLI